MKMTYKYSYCLVLTVLIVSCSVTFSGSGKNCNLIEVKSKNLGKYISTHGQILNDRLFSPYASEYAQSEEIDTVKILNEIYSDVPINNSSNFSRYISSYKFLSGDWTYFKSNSVCIYEVLKVTDTTTSSSYIAIIFDALPGKRVLEPDGLHLSIFNENVDLISSFKLGDEMDSYTFSNADMIYTDLRVIKGKLTTVITFTETGTGGAPETGKLFEFSIVKDSFRMVNEVPIEDGSKQDWVK